MVMLLASVFSYQLRHGSWSKFPADELLGGGWGPSPLCSVGRGLALMVSIVHSPRAAEGSHFE